jgi:antitoxin component HigA of HigAB toxin-antitoxin module
MPAPWQCRLFVRSESQLEKDLKGRSRNQTDHYRRALKEIEGLMHAKRNTPAGDRLDVLIVLIAALDCHCLEWVAASAANITI